jgi:hypothetical protein
VLTGGGGPGSGGGDCASEATYVYVLSLENDLYRFDPPAKAFTKIGPLGCQTSMTPNSMAIDRDAVAWVNYVQPGGVGDSAGALYRVSTLDASCEAAPTVTLPAGYYRIGMGYATDAAMSKSETLYIASITSGSLARVEGSTVLPVGGFGGKFAGQAAELTGTGDARLYGFFTTTPVEVAEIDKATGAVTQSVPLPTVEVPNAWAFSHWGGDFYLYTATFGTSRVNRYRPSDGSVDTSYMVEIGFRIVGAGVSTCAPTTPPK